jgi:hypothetical protein
MAETARKPRRYDTETWIRMMTSQVRKATRGRFFGEVKVQIIDGRIDRVTVTRSIKDPTVAVDDDGAVG